MKSFPILVAAAALSASTAGAADWPVLKTYEGECIERVKMPIGGIGTGTISLSGRGSLVDWEIKNRPAKGHVPYALGGPHFAIRCATARGEKVARLLEGPLTLGEYEGDTGSKAPRHGFPRFAKVVFKAAYPLAQIVYEDSKFPVCTRLEAFNPLVPGDADASGIPAVLFRWVLTNPTAEPLDVSVVASMPKDRNILYSVPDGVGAVTRASDIRQPGWNVGLQRYWRQFLNEGIVADTPKDDSTAVKDTGANLLCVKLSLAAGATAEVPFVVSWRYPDRKLWLNYDSTNACDAVGNWYCTRYATPKAAADDLFARLPELEAKTVAFVKSVLDLDAPDVLKEAALFNVSTLRTETCFRMADGHFFGWEGCYDTKGSCQGSCTHVWGYEHCLADLWPALARDMTELHFSPASMDGRGHIVNRIWHAKAQQGACSTGLAAADGQMQCIVKAYENWRKCGDDAWLRKLWPAIRKAISFCWVEGGWDADRDGVMEGCQHNTMDVEYYGPNPQMEFLYLAALEAGAAMADAMGDNAFAADLRSLAAKGSAWTEANLFNGAYYEHRIVPPKSVADIAPGLRHANMGARDLTNPDYQLGSGCLVDQLLGDYAARVVGLPSVVDRGHAAKTLETILAKCRRERDDDSFNCMRSFALSGERSLKMAWYDESRMPRSPFPYYSETMTGFEYVVAALLVMNGEREKGLEVVRDIRDRYDGRKRSPFDEAECGHHYVRAMAAWTVLQEWVRVPRL